MAHQQGLLGNRYRLDETLGRGGMGTVWRAHDEVLDRDVAVKEVLLPHGLGDAERSVLYERTFREARASARLSHPNVVTVHDVVEEGGRPWIVMEYVRARSLQDIIDDDGPVDPATAADIGRQTLDALRHAHTAGILHRDVKPSNVLITDEGRAVLTDFGIAQMEGDATLTQTGLVMGSPAYISPERARGERAVPASDLWALGATLYAAVEGKAPYERSDAIAALAASLTEPVPPPRNAGSLAPVLDGLLAREPGQRLTADQALPMLSDVTADDVERTRLDAAPSWRPPPPLGASRQQQAASPSAIDQGPGQGAAQALGQGAAQGLGQVGPGHGGLSRAGSAHAGFGAPVPPVTPAAPPMGSGAAADATWLDQGGLRAPGQGPYQGQGVHQGQSLQGQGAYPGQSVQQGQGVQQGQSAYPGQSAYQGMPGPGGLSGPGGQSEFQRQGGYQPGLAQGGYRAADDQRTLLEPETTPDWRTSGDDRPYSSARYDRFDESATLLNDDWEGGGPRTSPAYGRRNGPGRNTLLIVVLVIVMAAALGFVAWKHANGEPRGAGSGAGTGTGSSKSGPDGRKGLPGPGRETGLDGGPRTYAENGFSIVVPARWVRIVDARHDSVIWTSPDGTGKLQVDQTPWRPGADARANGTEAARKAQVNSVVFPGYTVKSLTDTTFDAAPAADWEFSFDDPATHVRRHAVDRFFKADGRPYAIYFAAPEAAWSVARIRLDSFYRSFRAGS